MHITFMHLPTSITTRAHTHAHPSQKQNTHPNLTKTTTQLAKVLELQENRLHSLYTRVNTAHTTGNELRVKINNLRREKLAFESAYR